MRKCYKKLLNTIKNMGNLKMPDCDLPDIARQLPDTARQLPDTARQLPKTARKLSNNYQYCPSNLQDYFMKWF